jgi:hypothetical protein
MALILLTLVTGCNGGSMPSDGPHAADPSPVPGAGYVTVAAPPGPVSPGERIEVHGRSGCEAALTLVSLMVHGREYALETTSARKEADGRYAYTASGTVPDVEPQRAQVFANTTCGRPEDTGTASATLQIGN